MTHNIQQLLKIQKMESSINVGNCYNSQDEQRNATDMINLNLLVARKPISNKACYTWNSICSNTGFPNLLCSS